MTCGPFDKPIRGASRRVLACAALAAAASLAGCVSTEAPVDTTSPAAPAVAEAPKALGAYPRWSQFPHGPQPVPPPSEIASNVGELQAAQADLLSSASKLEWTLSGTESFAAQVRAEINPAYATPAPTEEQGEAEAYARSLREKAAPPPAPK
jgi:outer membrane murein-binding lipoprotein Lpp